MMQKVRGALPDSKTVSGLKFAHRGPTITVSPGSRTPFASEDVPLRERPSTRNPTGVRSCRRPVTPSTEPSGCIQTATGPALVEATALMSARLVSEKLITGASACAFRSRCCPTTE